MKKSLFVLLLLLFCSTLFAAPYATWDGSTVPPDPQWVNDYAGILTDDEEFEIAALAKEIQDETTCQILVVTVQNLGGRSIEEYALTLARGWEVGWSDTNNGVLIVAAMDERELRIEVGYGLEGIVTDLVAGRIIDNIMTPAFKRSDFYTGFFEAEMAVFSLLTDDTVVKEEYESVLAGDKGINTDTIRNEGKILKIAILAAFFLFFVSLIVTIVFMWANMGEKTDNKKKSIFFGTRGFLISYGVSVLFWFCFFLSAFGLHNWSKVFVYALLLFPMLQFAGFLLIASAIVNRPSGGYRSGYTGYRSGYRSSGFSSSSSFSSGGFSSGGGGFSGGGGSFGGGGASGGW